MAIWVHSNRKNKQCPQQRTQYQRRVLGRIEKNETKEDFKQGKANPQTNTDVGLGKWLGWARVCWPSKRT